MLRPIHRFAQPDLWPLRSRAVRNWDGSMPEAGNVAPGERSQTMRNFKIWLGLMAIQVVAHDLAYLD